LWRDIYPKLSEAEPGLIGAILARGEAHVLRLSVLYALLDRRRAIQASHLEAAVAVWDFSVASARRIFGGRLGFTMADTILEALRRKSLTDTEIHALFGRHKNKNEIQIALNQILTAGKARFSTIKTDGRNATLWEAVA
jgi:hypothetical protein